MIVYVGTGLCAGPTFSVVANQSADWCGNISVVASNIIEVRNTHKSVKIAKNYLDIMAILAYNNRADMALNVSWIEPDTIGGRENNV